MLIPRFVPQTPTVFYGRICRLPSAIQRKSEERLKNLALNRHRYRKLPEVKTTTEKRQQQQKSVLFAIESQTMCMSAWLSWSPFKQKLSFTCV